MSVAFADYDGDGWPDVFVTNDNMPNFLFHNLGNGTFEEVALAGRRRPARRRQAGRRMGAEFKDYDNDGLPDLFFTALAGETYPAVPQRRQRQLHDATLHSRMRSAHPAAQRLGSSACSISTTTAGRICSPPTLT